MSIRWTIVTVSVSILLASAPVSAQSGTVPELPLEDSVSLLAQSITALSAEGLLETDQVLFLRADSVALRGALLDGLRPDFPRVRPYPTETGIHVCPDGGRPRFPRSSCPTIDDGVEVRIDEITESSDSLIILKVRIVDTLQARIYTAVFAREDGRLVLWTFELYAMT